MSLATEKTVNFSEKVLARHVKEWKEAARLLKMAQEEEKRCKEALIEACGFENYEGNGIKLAEISRKGSIDYNVIPELKGVDLEPYRKEETKYWKISLSLEV